MSEWIVQLIFMGIYARPENKMIFEKWLQVREGRRWKFMCVCVCVCLAEGMPRTQINKIRNKRSYNWYQRNTKNYKRPLWVIICEWTGQSREKQINF